MRNLPYISGAGLLLVGAARFLARADVVGALIAGLSAALALWWPHIRASSTRKPEDEWKDEFNQ